MLLSGLAPKFGVLVLARVLSGVGEASFQTVVPPYIDDIAPKVLTSAAHTNKWNGAHWIG